MSKSECFAGLTSGMWLAKTARYCMMAFQLGTFVTPAICKPLYTPEIFASVQGDPLIALRVVGLTNFMMIAAVDDSRHEKNECYLANALTMGGMGLIYVLHRVKPPIVNVPFVSSLFFVSMVNLIQLVQLDPSACEDIPQKGHPYLSTLPFKLRQYIKLGVGAGALLVGSGALRQAPMPEIELVYNLQIGLNLATSAALRLRHKQAETLDAASLAAIYLYLSRTSSLVGKLAQAAALVLSIEELGRFFVRDYPE